ncbi:MAG: sigma-70 family RNA polymerase sigma factor [Acidobacteria bacterium]|nr:sigma-70 family RNA polymerase sigma factor [Acidobacteriota bacterium]MBI3425197.1 sigma-70 family RNA polymerase sigma factor [Acidobacteriota bacterium]
MAHKAERERVLPTDVTQLLLDWNAGDQAALAELMPLVYAELRQIAARQLRRERHEHTLQPTALVHEAWLRLVQTKRLTWQNRAHFLGVAAELMRRILVDHARRRSAGIRGGGETRLALDEALDVAQPREVALLALDDALTSLAALDPRQSRIVELKYFGGLEIDEIAEVLGISPATVKRDWQWARAWLHREISR